MCMEQKYLANTEIAFLYFYYVEKMDLPFFIILFSNAGGGSSPAFQKRLEFLLREASWLTFLISFMLSS